MPRPRRQRDRPDLTTCTTDELLNELRSRSLDFAFFVSSPYSFSGFYPHDHIKYSIQLPPHRPNFLPTVLTILNNHQPKDLPNADHS